MSRFSFDNIRKKAIEAYENEVNISKGIQDEVKIYNERFPKALEPLAKLGTLIDEYEQGLFTSTGNIGEFDEGMVAGDTNEEKVWSFFLNKNYNKKAIAGVMGNLEAESGINPKNIQGGGKGPGTGLVQWTDGNGRWNQLEKWASEKGKDKWSIETQLDYLWLEMTNGSHDTYWSRAGRTLGVDLSGSKKVPAKKLGKINNIEVAMKAFELTIERAGKKAYAKRLKYANNFYEKYKDWSPGESAGASGQFLPPHRNASYRVTSEFGYRIHPIYGDRRLHAGIDVSSSKHTPLYTVGPGKVVQNKYDADGWGHYVVINHGSINGKEVYSLYAHMKQKSSLSIGQTLSGNEQVGVEATTGASTGIHLHLEIREGSSGGNWLSAKTVNPRNYITFK